MLRLFSYRKEKPDKTCAIVRYGAMGDALQTSSVFPFFKEQGYHITVYLVQNGYEVLKHDPHVDRFIVQDVDAIPNEWLGEFWGYEAKKYDKFINFSESVERTLLAMPGTTAHRWPQSMRHKYLNHNYLEFMHDIAEVPYKPMSYFYPTSDETAWALKELEVISGGAPVVLWSLGGSAVHKHWPHLDAAVAAITSVGIHVVTVGDELCKKQEEGFETNPLIHCRAWKWTIRQSMAFAQVCDMVIGPETGMMNSVAFHPVQKIVMLSHSSANNLTRDWMNCTTLIPQNTACYPCHRLHFGFDHCRVGYINGQGVGALCQVNISPEQLVAAVNLRLNASRRLAA
jgi:ADP-heptose:LPS heptosyltransferase